MMTAYDPKQPWMEFLNRRTRMPRFYIVICFSVFAFAFPVSFALAGGSSDTASWPPEEVADEAHNKFTATIRTLDVLVQKMHGSRYMTVGQPEPGVIEAERVFTKIGEYESPSDADEWSSLLTEASVELVARNIDGLVSFFNASESLALLDGMSYRYSFNWSEKGLTRACLPEHAEFRCGRCEQRREKNWAIEYSWSPADSVTWSRRDRDECFAKFSATKSEKVDAE